MKEGPRPQLGDLSSLRTNHQEARQQPLPCILKVRCLKERERREERRKKLNRRSATFVVFVCESEVRKSELRTTNGRVLTPCVAESISAEKGPFGGPFAFYRAFV
ncbi:hypothetical protein AVEN_257469-1 [Araneus ventricosus]|uniref:Uncharacterized protein n=1 Tax=Araneus ventricosus TaxID=182803 RepID=A0A4Y2PR93_ARAVE|nr:hypothetical protein AVEN_257469-1 [Araneus ventricosus]